jgi:hypothetical protein
LPIGHPLGLDGGRIWLRCFSSVPDIEPTADGGLSVLLCSCLLYSFALSLYELTIAQVQVTLTSEPNGHQHSAQIVGGI